MTEGRWKTASLGRGSLGNSKRSEVRKRDNVLTAHFVQDRKETQRKDIFLFAVDNSAKKKLNACGKHSFLEGMHPLFFATAKCNSTSRSSWRSLATLNEARQGEVGGKYHFTSTA